MSWLDKTDDDYARYSQKWGYTREVDTCEYSDRANVKNYLHKRAHWEKNTSLDVRIAMADPNMDFSLLMGKIIGQALTTEGDDIRVFEKDGAVGLGSIADDNSPIGRLWQNTDGEGTNYPVLWRKYARKQLVMHWMYILVDGIKEIPVYDHDGNQIGTSTADASIKLIDPDMVLDKDETPGLPSWIKVKHTVQSGGNWASKNATQDSYTIYHLDGWDRYIKSPDGKSEILTASGQYEFYTDNTKTQRRLPIFCVKLPFDIYIAHYLARKSIAIFNQESQRDSFIANADIHFVDEGAPVEFEARRDDIQAGETHHNMEKGTKAYYISPPSDPANLATEVIDKKRKNLYEVAYQIYGDAAKESTATEIKQEARSGIEALLRQLVTTWDEAENTAVFLLEQVYYLNDTKRWGAHKIERSKKFAILDPLQFVNLVVDLVFGDNPIPITEEMMLEAARFIWVKQLGFSLGENQDADLKKAIKLHMDERHGSAREISGDGLNTPAPVFEEL